MKEHERAKSDNFPCSFWISSKVQLFLARNSSITFCMPASFSAGSDQAIVTESKFTPKTVPKVVGPKAFSCFSQFGAKGTLSFLEISTYRPVKRSISFDPLGETMGTSSSWRCTLAFGIFPRVHTMFTIVSGRGSKLAGAALLPKIVVVSKKNFHNHSKPYRCHCSCGFGISL